MSDMADVLAEHGIYGMSAGTHSACRCDRKWVLHGEYRAHLEARLAAAGFGPVREAAAGALEDAADAITRPQPEYNGTPSRFPANWLRARAATVRGGE